MFNALLREREGVANPYLLALDAYSGNPALRRRAQRIQSERYFAAVAAYSLKIGHTKAAADSLFFAYDLALSRARAKGQTAQSVLDASETKRRAQLQAARSSAAQEAALRSADKKARARRVAFDYLQEGRWLAPATDVWDHVTSKLDCSLGTARRLLGAMKALRADARDDFQQDKERRARAAGGLR